MMKSPCRENTNLKRADYKAIDKHFLSFIFSLYSYYRKMKTLFFRFFENKKRSRLPLFRRKKLLLQKNANYKLSGYYENQSVVYIVECYWSVTFFVFLLHFLA